MIQKLRRAIAAAALVSLSMHAQADLAQWVTVVAVGTPVSFTSTSVVVPSVVDIGSLSPAQGMTYEFVANCTNAGLSSTLMGARNTGFGTSSALKFEQYADTASFGITNWGVADYSMAPNTINQDIHVAFVVDTVGVSTDLYVDGVYLGSVSYAPHLTNTVGLGEWYDAAGSVDIMTGTIYGFAAYEAMLAPAEITEHASAFLSTVLGTPYCFGVGCPCGNDDPNAGCINSSGAGAKIEAQGSTSVGTDDLTLLGSQLMPGMPVVLFVGPQQMNSGTGALFGDGLRCAGGPLQRLGVRVTDTLGQASWGPGMLGSATWMNAGDTRRMQLWSVDSIGGPCSQGFNTSHGLELVFGP